MPNEPDVPVVPEKPEKPTLSEKPTLPEKSQNSSEISTAEKLPQTGDTQNSVGLGIILIALSASYYLIKRR
ncbi:LPXTG cell wall anchor domain-containing protein [Listeria farberi]|uniref:LPXTG cell wall anchor domain-containing protein n=1 Tax=Listeria farberi TaxID=2713500 RepID=UPI003CCDCD37